MILIWLSVYHSDDMHHAISIVIALIRRIVDLILTRDSLKINFLIGRRAEEEIRRTSKGV